MKKLLCLCMLLITLATYGESNKTADLGRVNPPAAKQEQAKKTIHGLIFLTALGAVSLSAFAFAATKIVAERMHHTSSTRKTTT